jgi:serine/threonine protein kinase
MSYPQLIDYNDAVQNPTHSFVDHELKASNVRTNALGLPLVLSGGLALTYTAATAHRKYAVRCFQREIPSIESKYAQISSVLTSLRSKYFVEFTFHRYGINVNGKAYPIVVMEWIEGDPLGVWLDKNYNNPDSLRKARLQFREMAAFLENNGIGHGDIQNGNVMMSNQDIKLIDYDGMYVPGLPLGVGTEIGHKHFQAPSSNN